MIIAFQYEKHILTLSQVTAERPAPRLLAGYWSPLLQALIFLGAFFTL